MSPRHWSVWVAALSAASALAVGALPADGAVARSGSAVVAAAMRSALATGGVHEVVTGNTSYAGTFTMTDDIATTEGRQVTVYANGGHDTLLVFASTRRVYERADAFGLLDEGVTNDPAPLEGKWMTLSGPSAIYNFLAVGSTLGSDLAQYLPSGTLKPAAQRVVDGQRVVPWVGATPLAMAGTSRKLVATLYLSSAAPNRPVGFVLADGDFTVKVAWTHWGHVVHLVEPLNTVPRPATP